MADHSKNPISSNMSEIRITATKVKVAFQTIPVTSSTSRKDGNKNLYKLNHDVLDDITSRLTLLSSSTVPCICETVEKGEC